MITASSRRDVGRLNQLVTDMLQFARPRPPELMPTDLAALAREVVTMARTSDGPESNVELKVGGDASVVTMADGNQVRQVLWNLVRYLSTRLRETTDKVTFLAVTGRFS